MAKLSPILLAELTAATDEFTDREETLSDLLFISQLFPSKDAISGDMTKRFRFLNVSCVHQE